MTIHQFLDMGWGALLAVLLVGCDAVGPDPPPSVARDSAGVGIVENARPSWTADDAWVIEPEPVLEVGALVGAVAVEFGSIGDAARFPDGTIAVVEDERREIRLFGPEGFHLETLTGVGGRPFEAPPSVSVVAPDTLLVHDRGSSELVWMDRAGTVARRAGLPVGGGRVEVTPAGAVRVTPVDVPADGEGVVERRSLIERIPPPWTDAQPIAEVAAGLLAGSEGTALESPFAPRSEVAVHPVSSEVAISHASRWEIRRYGPGGELDRIVRARSPRTRLDVELLQYIRGEAVEGARTPEEARTRLDAFDLLPRPDSAPAIGELHLDAAGHLWVGRWTEGNVAGLEVFDPAGRWLGVVPLPPEFGTVLEIGEDHLLAHHRDEIGVSYLRVYRIRRGPPGS